MDFPIRTVAVEEFPSLLREIPQPPAQLTYRGTLPPSGIILLAVVGSRKYTRYGADVVTYLIEGLRGYPVGIVSGLALGIDSLAHEAALKTGLYTLAIPGGGLDDSVIYPRSHLPLARRILEAGGGLLSEYEPTFGATPWSFPERNRLVCGIAPATLVIEAGEKSGSLITARLATDYNRELLVVPGNIFSEMSKGVHQFLKLGATPITDARDILEILHIDPTPTAGMPSPATTDLSPEENRVLQILSEPRERDELIRALALPTKEVSVLLMQLEMKGFISEREGYYRRTS